MRTTFDIAATIAAVAWPVVVVVIMLAYRAKIPAVVEGLASRVQKLEFAGVSLELAIAKPFTPVWSGSPTALDLRHTATAVQVHDSTARTFLAQLVERGDADYAEVNLGTGREWLTSRLYILAIVFARMKGLEAFVFVETTPTVRKRYVGWARPDVIRWTLAKRFPFLEQAYADAYAALLSQARGFVVSSDGRLGLQWSPADPGPSIELLKEFLSRVQSPPFPAPLPADASSWVTLDTQPPTLEHAQWVTAEALEEMIGEELSIAAVPSTLLGPKRNKWLGTFLPMSTRFVAVVSDDRRFEYLVDRSVLLEQVARQVSEVTVEA